MDNVQALILALIQGLTEFLPISSSAHLILPAQMFGWPDQGLAFDVAVHLGTLLAVVAYYRRDLWAMTRGAGDGVMHRRMNADLHHAPLPDRARERRRDAAAWPHQVGVRGAGLGQTPAHAPGIPERLSADGEGIFLNG